jgi:GTP-binding protein
MFVDQIKVHAKAGEGGNGCVSFLREKFVPKGGPNGGDGGRGGDIILRADTHTDNLAGFFYEPIIRGSDGENGLGKNLYGRGAKPKYVRVPVGTLVYRVHGPALPEGETVRRGVMFYNLETEPASPEAPVKKKLDIHSPDLELIADLTRPEEEFVLCKGGNGGKGNVHFKSSTNRIPREATPGESGEEGDFVFELRTIADAGLVGYPNAGKSTLLGRISSAHPKVAAYPFTTLHPIIGVVEFPGYDRATVADIPGLIEGAHLNVGLGHEFLRHIVRCKLLLFVLDMAGSEGRNPIQDLGTLREELKLYDPTLAKRPWVVIANKMDLPEADANLKAFKRRFRKREVIPISASEDEGIDALKERLHELIGRRADAAPAESTPEVESPGERAGEGT